MNDSINRFDLFPLIEWLSKAKSFSEFLCDKSDTRSSGHLVVSWKRFSRTLL